VLSSLHTFWVTDEDAVFAPYTLPRDPALAEILGQLPTEKNGFFRGV
jgi:hypothetical protein